MIFSYYYYDIIQQDVAILINNVFVAAVA